MNNLTIPHEKLEGIHPTAIIEEGAEIGKTAVIGAYAYIGSCVKIGAGTIVHHHATVEGNTHLGTDNEIFPYALIGGKTHDLKYCGGKPGLKIGNNNTFREYTTVHAATSDGEFTVIGNNNVFLAYSHVAHDCKIGDHLIISSHSALAGHVIVQDHVNIGWNVGVHQFCHLGSHCMIGACSKIVQSVLPFMLADGNPAVIRTFNKIGLERAGYTLEQLEVVRFIYQTLYRKGLNRSQALNELKEHEFSSSVLVKSILSFVENSDRGLL